MNKGTAPKAIAIIPSRYESQRFPGKPLALIAGKSLIQRTYENALHCKSLDDVVVATDDQRILDHVLSFGGKVIMTSQNCATGTDRLAEVLKNTDLCNDVDIILNIQGDEPCLSHKVITDVINLLHNDQEAVMGTAAAPLTSLEEASRPSVVKCVIDQQGNALYFSRALIPAGKTQALQENSLIYRHLGIYAFRKEFLSQYGDLPPTPLQMTEDLEQLKVLEHGYRIKVAIVDEVAIGVDTPEDISKLEKFLCKQNTFSSQAE
ncbi:MAG: 3-deoxy-manno-octulosonate cytidylyltransferase (CMP-KDO synthetase) [Chlamydiales bacterium]|jgi:3-deoxy-manno-octulosonate cytidylyltransferase (CMP-KDO synthetase)